MSDLELVEQTPAAPQGRKGETMNYALRAALAAGLIVGSLETGAFAAHGGDHAMREMPSEKLKKKLGLTEEQAEKFAAAMKSHREAAQPLREELKKDMKKLRDQVEGKAADAEIKSTLERLDKTHQAMQAENEKLKAATASFLTPTQRARMMLRMMKRHRNGRGMGMKREKDGKKEKEEDDEEEKDD